MPPNVPLISTPLFTFLVEFGINTAILFCPFTAVLLAASAQVLGSNHGHTAAWKQLRQEIFAIVPGNRVWTCNTSGVVAIAATLSRDERLRLQELMDSIRRIERVERRLEILRRRYRCLALVMILSVILGTILSAPILFGLQALVDTKSITLISAICSAFGVWSISYHHAAAWSLTRDRASRSSVELKGAVLKPLA
jgi:hypothetical protein